jgi:hypothetical protein
MKRVLAMMMLLSVAVWAKTDFSGAWALNESKSELGEQNGPGGGRFRGFNAGKMTITQTEDQMVIERTMKNRDGEDVTNKETYTLDGKECVNESRGGEKTTVCKWSADGKTLTMESLRVINRDGNSMEMKSVEIFSLSADGKVLSMDITSNSPRGERKVKLAYDKK